MSSFKSRFLSTVSAIGILLAFTPSCSYSQVYGCKDPAANNYNPQATINDGSCTYNTTMYTPPIKVDPMNAALLENSGLQMVGNYLWTLNDGGSSPAIYRIDTLTNAILQTVTLGGTTNVDWEDIAFDGTHFYIGDFGNNLDGARRDLKIYKFRLSSIPDHTTNPNVTIPADQIKVINFIYSDQPQPPQPTDANSTKFDCEAMIVDAGKIHLFTKNWIDLNTTHYVIADTIAGTYTALPLETLATNYLVTGADKAVGQQVVALLGYQNFGFANHFMHFLSDYSTGLYFNGNKRRIDLPDATVMGQGEGITFRSGTYGYLSNERFTRTSGSFTLTVNQKLRAFDASNFIPASVLPLELKQFKVANVQGKHKITWEFDLKVEHLQVQHSINGINFSNVKSYSSSLSDAFYNTATAGVNCYRLSWQKNIGAINYSNTICLNSNENSLLKKAVLKATGELSFSWQGTEATNYSFQLLSTDGKLLAQATGQRITPGTNRINFKTSSTISGSVYLVSKSDSQKETTLLQVRR